MATRITVDEIRDKLKALGHTLVPAGVGAWRIEFRDGEILELSEKSLKIDFMAGRLV